jgi:hypothetical protein
MNTKRSLGKDLDTYGAFDIDHPYGNSAERSEKRSRQQGQLDGSTTL